MVGRHSVEPPPGATLEQTARQSLALPKRQPNKALEPFISRGLDGTPPMAGNDRDTPFRVARRRPIEMATPMGLLDFSPQQRPLDRLGLARSRLGINRPANRSRPTERSRRNQERTRVTSELWALRHAPCCKLDRHDQFL